MDIINVVENHTGHFSFWMKLCTCNWSRIQTDRLFWMAELSQSLCGFRATVQNLQEFNNYLMLWKVIHIACYLSLSLSLVLKHWYWNVLLIVPISMLLECYMIAYITYSEYMLSYNIPITYLQGLLLKAIIKLSNINVLILAYNSLLWINFCTV